jgi:hypothetical protein
MGYLSQQAWFYGVFLLDPTIATTFPFVSVLMFVLVFRPSPTGSASPATSCRAATNSRRTTTRRQRRPAGNLISALVKLPSGQCEHIDAGSALQLV